MAVSADVVGLTGSSSHVVLTGVCALLGGSHDDLRLRADQLSWSLSVVFFTGGSAGLGPDGSVLVCADVPPIGAALRGKQWTAVIFLVPLGVLLQRRVLSRFRGYKLVPTLAAGAFFADGAVAAPFRRRSCGGGLAGGAS
uniref:Uncharacterized protein n=1 Tax=Oryza sativa subsp. japonica TaxID=39947 RepID=Q6H424_ORYSJ|nr:hypothetical protein [Oryza sativa Japonica Group]BAD29642.1 hypothetical protein [Oryza sativa Japonica Group]